MSETIYYPTATTLVTSNTTVTGNATIGVDRTAAGAYLTPSTSNAAVIIQWIQKTTSSYAADIQASSPYWGQGNNIQFLTQYLYGGYIGGALLPDGRVMMNSGNNGNGLSYFNPVTNVITTALAGIGNSNAQNGCVLLPDGRVGYLTWTQGTAPSINIINPVTNAVTITLAPVQGAFGWLGGCLTPGGNVCLCPYGSSNTVIFNTKTNAYAYYGAPWVANGTALNYIGAVLHPNGNVYFAPGFNSGQSIGVFNESAGSFTSITGVGTTAGYWGGVLLPDGKIAFIPQGATVIKIFNPSTNTFTNGPAATGYRWGCLLPDGKALFTGGGLNVGIYNYLTNSFTTVSTTLNTGESGGAVLPDGRVFLHPGNTNGGVGLLTGYNRPVAREFCMHPFFNKF